ncbi:hypothetical protein [Thaumasiovibrio sp. DFM-14]|uniref:hypothetical protein n=1 Tax=Thaumasiovibrio sp. DFM-14 TaxID=3384792 RepID=UPI0039A1212E
MFSLLTTTEWMGLTIAIVITSLCWTGIYIRYIKNGHAHQRFMMQLWSAIKNTSQGENLRTLGIDGDNIGKD